MSKPSKTADQASTEAASTVADTVLGGAGDDVVLASDELDPSDQAVTGVPRDELHDSIDRNTGALTEEAVALRAGRATE